MRKNPSSTDSMISLVMLGVISLGGWYVFTNWDKITKAPGWQCNHPVTPPGGTAGLSYNKGKCCWFDSTGRCIYLADGAPY